MTLLTLLQASELESFTGGIARSLMGMPPSSGLPTVLRECLLFRGWISRLGERASPVSSS